MSRAEVDKFARALLVYAVANREWELAGRVNGYLVERAAERIGKLRSYNADIEMLIDWDGDEVTMDKLRAGLTGEIISFVRGLQNAALIKRIERKYGQ